MNTVFRQPQPKVGLKGSESVPAFRSVDCQSRIKTCEVQSQLDSDGREYCVNPFTGGRVYADEAAKQSVKFTPLS